METSQDLTRVQNCAIELMRGARHEYLTPEHVLYVLCSEPLFASLLESFIDVPVADFKEEITRYFATLDKVENPDNGEAIELSYQLNRAYQMVVSNAASSQCNAITIPHLINAILHLGTDSVACSLLCAYISDKAEFVSALTDAYGSGREDAYEDDDEMIIEDEDDVTLDDLDSLFGDSRQEAEPWRSHITDLTALLREHPESHNPLIGREAELERTIQVLCRCDKNNPLHVGEPGVGKTALVYGLTQRIIDGRVPERLRGSNVYLLDLGTLLAGTQYRGDFEKRMKMVMEGVSKAGNAIVYIDEIHNLVGAGAIGEGSLDASNMLKPYLENGAIRFIGSTTYAEYNRYFAKSQGIVRRFQQIDILEPSVEETVLILEGLRSRYEKFHGVVYDKGVFEHATKMAARYINDRFLPDKAIDLIDEAGALLEVANNQPAGIVTCNLVDQMLAKVCKVDSLADSDDDTARLEDLEQRISARIYGQDEAVRQVVEAVQMSHAGLMEEDKPVASFLFVGPTGVGKTEVAKVLSQELHLELIRFDMSEYAEKHTVAKLIGSPAGYVGYEDGGLLTDAVRKTPHCVLLFDEIEKAHPDVFNIFLQMMDYARLTDNKGRHADFRHAVIIMTSNAGAQYASQASVGFAGGISAGDAMLATVKRTFKPEFLARLSATVVFHDMDTTMATMILDKKLRDFSLRLETKNVSMDLTPAAHAAMLKEGFSQKSGAREMDRVIAQRLKPLFTRAILFGQLKNGGHATIDYQDNTFLLLP